jgi:hypothetical protein|tara:strand:- start:1581 stop:1856 length:276 start_codon:yes stop_codon:yes gene_type:complete
MIPEILLVVTTVTTIPDEPYLYYTQEGYEVQRFDCTPTRCTGVDGTYIGHPDNVMNVIPPIEEEHVNTRYHCDGFCYDDFGFIIGVDPNRK